MCCFHFHYSSLYHKRAKNNSTCKTVWPQPVKEYSKMWVAQLLTRSPGLLPCLPLLIFIGLCFSFYSV